MDWTHIEVLYIYIFVNNFKLNAISLLTKVVDSFIYQSFDGLTFRQV